MQYKILEAEYNGQKFRIEEDNPGAGAYLYILIKMKSASRIFYRTILLPASRWLLMDTELHLISGMS